jgi:hypothetical protein
VLECHCFLIAPPIYDRVGVLSNETAGTINLSTSCKKTPKDKDLQHSTECCANKTTMLYWTQCYRNTREIQVTFRIRGFAPGIVVGCYKTTAEYANMRQPFLSNGFANMFSRQGLNYNNEELYFPCGPCRDVIIGTSWELQLVQLSQPEE